ncbi:MAG: hypothetical protein AAF993_12655 [Pseudomonadota bacterium]
MIEIAEFEPLAAVILARDQNPDANTNHNERWILQAVALSGKPGPLMMLAASQIVETHERGESPGDVKTVKHHKRLMNRYVLNEIAHRMGDPRARPDYWQQQLGHEALTEAEAMVITTLRQLGDLQYQKRGVNEFEPPIDIEQSDA